MDEQSPVVETRAGNFDTTREPDTKLTGLGLCLMGLCHKRVDPFMFLKRVVSRVTRE
jgi:hypothetical protein